MWDSRHFFGRDNFAFFAIFAAFILIKCVVFLKESVVSDDVLYRFSAFCRNGKRGRFWCGFCFGLDVVCVPARRGDCSSRRPIPAGQSFLLYFREE